MNEFIIKNGFFSQGSSNITGSLTVTQGITGSLFGTASFATTASYIATASYANQAATASYILQAISSSFATTASYIATASYANGALSSSYALTASYSLTSLSSSYALTASYADQSLSSSYALTASYANQALSSSYAATASIATTALNTSDVLIYVKNVTGATIPKGKVVRISGATGDNALISTASYEDDNNSANTLGILNESIDNDAFGYAMTEGTLLGIDTDLFTAGQLLYLGPTGSIIGYAPEPPLHNVRLGQALRIQQINGSMYVRIDNGYELDELHNVLIISGSDGDLLVASGSNGNGKKLYINAKQLTGSYALTGSLDIIDGGVTGSLFGTSSWANDAITASYSVTASYALNGGVTQIVAGNNISINPSDGYGIVTITNTLPAPATGSLIQTASISGNVITFTKGDSSTFNITIESSSYAAQAATASYVASASYATQAMSASYAESSSYATNTSYLNGKDSAVFITTGSNGTSQTINGSLTINQDLTVLGSSSIQYITSSQLLIADNIVSVNTFNPSLRFGGLAVIDSGSSPQTSGSLLFDSQNNQWIFIHQSDSTSAVTSSVLIMGPQTFNDVGNETTITANRLTKGTGGDLGEHIGDSNITDTGTVVSINSNTYVTGSLDVTQGITGSLFGTASWALDSVTASYAIAALSSSYALTASYTPFNYGLVYAIATQNFLT